MVMCFLGVQKMSTVYEEKCITVTKILITIKNNQRECICNADHQQKCILVQISVLWMFVLNY